VIYAVGDFKAVVSLLSWQRFPTFALQLLVFVPVGVRRIWLLKIQRLARQLHA